jgi:hypothetical protein
MQSGFLTGSHHVLKLMASETRITLRYNGPSVDDGTLPIDDVVSALQGFAGAYNKVSGLRWDGLEHQLRVSAIKTGSFEMVILVWLLLGQAPGPLQNLEIISDATRWVIARIFSMIEAKKHIKNKPFDLNIKGDNNTVILVNAEGAELAIPPEIVEFIRNKTLDADLNKIVSPLEPEKIESTEIVAESEGQEALIEKVTSGEREYFRPSSTVTTREADITGKFISLNKESNRGTFELPNGNHIPYRYTGLNPDNFPHQFARKGPVRVSCVATLDENLEPTQIEVKSTAHLQGELPLPSS